MSMDLNVKVMKKNAYRITKERGVSALRIRVPGGQIDAKHLKLVQEIADKYGDGKIHITTRQGFEITGIPFESVEEVNKVAKELIEGLEINAIHPEKGYPAAGTRNVSACIGNRVCPFANYNTTEFARRIEKAIFPNDFHVKVALTGCPNDCIKAHMQDFGIIGMADVEYEVDRCIGCEACVKNCKRRVTGALTMHNGKVKRDEKRCIGCGECVLKCPTNAWSRNPNKLYKLVIMGRTGKKNPRLAMPFLEWVDEESIIKIIKSTYKFIDKFIDRSLDKEHIGYIVDRVGYNVFKQCALEDVNLGPKVKIAEFIDFGAGYKYEKDAFMDTTK